MKKLLLLCVIMITLSTYTKAQGYQYTPVQVDPPTGLNTLINLMNGGSPIFSTPPITPITQPQQNNVQWYYSIGMTIDGSKRIKIKYQINLYGEVCEICSAYVWNGSEWISVSVNNDQYGYYVYYFAQYYF